MSMQPHPICPIIYLVIKYELRTYQIFPRNYEGIKKFPKIYFKISGEFLFFTMLEFLQVELQQQ